MIKQFLCMTLATVGLAAAADILRSPNGNIEVSVDVKDGRRLRSVAFSGQPIIRVGLLGVETTPDNLNGSYTPDDTGTASGDTTWKPIWGFLSQQSPYRPRQAGDRCPTGENWFIASMSGQQTAADPFALNFLAPVRTYRATIDRDPSRGRKAVHFQQQVDSLPLLPIAMKPNGGHLMILEAVST